MDRRNIISIFLFAVYLGLVAWCCFGHFESLPDVGTDLFGIPMDKVVHFIMFLPFPLLCFASFDFLVRKKRKSLILLALAIIVGLLIAGATEAGQSLTTYRSADPQDLLADALGLVAGSILTVLILLARKHT